MEIKHKKAARNSVIQALYNYHVGEYDDIEIFLEDFYNFIRPKIKPPVKQYFELLFKGIISNMDKIIKYIDKSFRGDFENLNITEKSIFYYAIYEMNFLNVDKNLVISEALRLSDKFIGELFSKKVNAFLDNMKKEEL